MALTTDILKANEVLAGLTDEQLNAITTLSQNDENSVIAQKTGKIYGDLDADILAVSGVEKNGTEKTYDYAKRVLAEFKTKAEGADGLQSQITTLTKEKAKLEKAIADGTGDIETKKALNQAKADLTAITKQFNDLKKLYDDAESNHAKELFGMQIDADIKGAVSGIKFKAGLPESATSVLMKQAIDKIKGFNPEYVDNGQGGKVLVFKDGTGAIMRNPNNQLNPYTAGDLLKKELDTMGILDKGRQQQGGGTSNPHNGDRATIIDISGARTRTEAYDIIANGLMAKGLTIGSDKFNEEMSAIWKDNNISALPER